MEVDILDFGEQCRYLATQAVEKHASEPEISYSVVSKGYIMSGESEESVILPLINEKLWPDFTGTIALLVIMLGSGLIFTESWPLSIFSLSTALFSVGGLAILIHLLGYLIHRRAK
jgi:hypothetical protein